MKQLLLPLRKIYRLFLPSSRIVNILTRMGEIIGRAWPWKNKSALFFFFPYPQVGGAERVHADIVACFADQKPWVFFTNESKDQKFKFLFEKNAKLFDVPSVINNRYTFYICLGALAAFINRHPQALVFGCNNVFFYQLLPHLRRDVRRIDLLHAFGGGIEHVSLPFVAEIDTRVVINRRAFSDLAKQYASNGILPHLLERIILINNQVAVPIACPEKPGSGSLKVIYVGRGAEEKRVHLIGQAAHQCRQAGIPAEFIFVGDVKDTIAPQHYAACIFKGEITQSDRLNKIYDEADILIMASSREGVPVSMMEAMAHGVVAVSTDVGGISDHVKHGVNGMLIRCESQEEIVISLVNIIEQLSKDRALLKEMARNAYEYAREHFEPSRFRSAYRQLIINEQGNGLDSAQHHLDQR